MSFLEYKTLDPLARSLIMSPPQSSKWTDPGCHGNYIYRRKGRLLGGLSDEWPGLTMMTAVWSLAW